MRNKAALFLVALVLVSFGCATNRKDQVSTSTKEQEPITYQPEKLPFVLNTPSGARSGTVEAAVGFDTKSHSVKIKLSQDPLLAAHTDYVVWYLSRGKLNIYFDNPTLQNHVTCHNRTCYLAPANFPIGVYRYTIKVHDHPHYPDLTLDPDLDIRW